MTQSGEPPYLETNNSRLSLSESLRWSLSTTRPFGPLLLLLSEEEEDGVVDELAAAFPFIVVLIVDGVVRCANVSLTIASKSNGIGGFRFFHMSAIINKFLISALKTFFKKRGTMSDGVCSGDNKASPAQATNLVKDNFGNI